MFVLSRVLKINLEPVRTRYSDGCFAVFETLRVGDGMSLGGEGTSSGGERGLARALSMVPPDAGRWMVRERSLLQRASAGVMQLDLGRSRLIG